MQPLFVDTSPCLLRSMIPHKTKRGAAAMDRLKVFEGVPPAYETVKRMVVPDALKVLRLQHGHKSVKLGDLAATVRRQPAVLGCLCQAKQRLLDAVRSRAKLQSILHCRDASTIEFCDVVLATRLLDFRISSCHDHPALTGPQVGWKHQDAVKELEEKRKVRSAAYYEQKKKLNALRTKAAAEA
jgi:hypothetical protein